VQLADLIAEKENEIEREIKTKISQHQRWNENYVDRTRFPLTPPLEENFNPSFRPAITEYLPTPPASHSSHHSADQAKPAFDSSGNDPKKPPHKRQNTQETSPPNPSTAVTVRYATPPTLQGPRRGQIAFRRRFGRGGRQLIDRRKMHPSKDQLPFRLAERFKYDRDDDEGDDDENIATFPIDPYNISSMRYRAAIAGTHQHHAQAQAQRRAQMEAHQQAAANAQHQQHAQHQQRAQQSAAG
jgi:enhancer of polycomb-like protein